MGEKIGILGNTIITIVALIALLTIIGQSFPSINTSVLNGLVNIIN